MAGDRRHRVPCRKVEQDKRQRVTWWGGETQLEWEICLRSGQSAGVKGRLWARGRGPIVGPGEEFALSLHAVNSLCKAENQ